METIPGIIKRTIMEEKDISYREATNEIEAILEKIENGETDIDALSKEIERAASLLQICKERLFRTEQEVESIIRQTQETGK
jgi:exodeoxyribonuclease VII small subunit